MNRRLRLAIITLVGSAATTVILMLVYALLTASTNSAEIRETQLEGTPLGKKLQSSSERILDCTEPGGKCFERSQKQTAKAVGDIGRYVVLASACAADVSPNVPVDDRVAVITACVTERLSN